MELVGLALLGIFGGLLTTTAGIGGGMVLVVVLSLLRDPRYALAVSAPALLLSNAHRAWMFRARLDRRVATAFALGLLPGALGGGLLLPSLPTWLLQAILVAVTALALVRARGWLSWSPRPRAMMPLGLGIGVIAATSGGAAPLVGPVLVSAGLRGEAYVATVAVAGCALHVGRVAGYTLAGMLGPALLPSTGALLGGLLLGNLLGRTARRRMPEGLELRVELGALVVCTLLAAGGLVR